MAAYETYTTLSITATITRARHYFEEQQGLPVIRRLGTLHRWRGLDGDIVELRVHRLEDGGTRVELDTTRSDKLVLAFIRDLPRTTRLHALWGRLRGRQ